MNKLYSVHDHWTDINKKNDVDIESIDGVITGIKVNGEDYGGGSSDFSTAKVTITNNTGTDDHWLGCLASADAENRASYPKIFVDLGENNYDVIMFGGFAQVIIENSTLKQENISTTGAVKCIFNSMTKVLVGLRITGDCTITIESDGGGGGGK